MNIEKRLADVLRAVLSETDSYHTCSHCSRGEMESPVSGENLTEGYAALAAYDAQQRGEPQSPVPHNDDEGAAVDTWRCDDGEFITKRGPFGSMQVACVDTPEDARRIVACVNALSGMTLAEIESFVAPGELGRCAMLWAQEDDA